MSTSFQVYPCDSKIAGAIAILTNGFVYSGDGAWDIKLLPSFGYEFLNSFPRPEACTDKSMSKWFKECVVLDIIKKFS
ncbi:MAG TPA: hypothetical protein PK566_16660 [Pseudobacteroides sp.]|nr:hypothetical protein [Pseudobacteroides sp.]